MLPIPFADLKAGYFDLQDEIDKAVRRCLESGAYINGAEVDNFCTSLAEYLQVKHVIPCANGTDALQVALMALGLKEGDEVVIPAFGYVSPVEVAALLQLKPVFVDIDPATFLLDENQLENTITSHTRAIIPVHLFGQNASMEPVLEIAKKYDLYIVEDAAQSLGSSVNTSSSTYCSGTAGHIGCTSFFPTKNLGCMGDGGAMFTNDDLLALKLKSISSHGQSTKYVHETVGVNSRLDAIQAAILAVKLPKLDRYNARRTEIARYYNSCFQDIGELETPFSSNSSSHIYHQYILKAASNALREGLAKWLKNAQISTMAYYPKPLHLQQAYKYLGYRKGSFPVAEDCCERVLALPVYPELNDAQIAYIAESVQRFFRK